MSEQTKTRERVRQHLIAGAQAALARAALSDLAITLEQMCGDDHLQTKVMRKFNEVLDEQIESLSKRLAEDAPDLPESTRQAIYYHTPGIIRAVSNNLKQPERTQIHLSGDYSRAAVGHYVLMTRDPEQPEQYNGLGIAWTPEAADHFLSSGYYKEAEGEEHQRLDYWITIQPGP